MWGLFQHLRLPWLLASLSLLISTFLVRAYRWRLLLRGLKVYIGYARLAELYFVGNFFNTFLPSGFGGDVVRVIEVAKEVSPSLATGTVLLDRLTGLVMLFVLALLSAPFRPDGFPSNLLWLVGAGAGLVLLVCAILLEGSLLRRLIKPLPVTLAQPASRLIDAVQGCGWRAVSGAFAVSLLFNLLLSAWWFSSGRALGVDVPFSYYLLVMPLLSIPLLVPSVAGLGPRELLAPVLFDAAGMGVDTAVSLSLLIFALNRFAGLLGAPVYLIGTIRDSRSRILPTSGEERQSGGT
jgi:uncharacterized membrane protein YbhN (UPF0104 family)